ncbi:type 1 glutamine amidotransferase [Haloarchaeobius amylolyticus]|uniref:type 1 glutamine amidotransferase n=1 Tax=Haloarchaeobius amylolyticus TaxID=1198296 RepID=UPI00226D9B3C|nr:type 1 glutamine amidotransferase [Haloarchaeobius amylolyticus]
MSIACLAPPSRFDYPAAIERVLQKQLADQPDLERFAPHHGTLPAHTDYDLVVVAGSHAHVTDPEPWFDALGAYLDDALATETPVLGVCFGHQFLAGHLGGRVESLPDQRTGLSTIERTAASDDHPAFRDLPREFESFVYHGDHVASAPPGATVLARDDSGIQAFADRDRDVLGIQFHPEFTPAMAARVGADSGSSPTAIDRRLGESRRLYGAVVGPLGTSASREDGSMRADGR